MQVVISSAFESELGLRQYAELGRAVDLLNQLPSGAANLSLALLAPMPASSLPQASTSAQTTARAVLPLAHGLATLSWFACSIFAESDMQAGPAQSSAQSANLPPPASSMEFNSEVVEDEQPEAFLRESRVDVNAKGVVFSFRVLEAVVGDSSSASRCVPLAPIFKNSIQRFKF